MLQQIIKDMYIDPDLLAELSDDQKQLIYIKIREEQVRRWTEFEGRLDKQSPVILPSKKTSSKKRNVDFMLGEDENPWVWVMGEHPGDKSIDDILEEEARAKAREKAEKEAGVIREKEEREAEQALIEEERRLEVARLEQERKLAKEAVKRKEAEAAQRLARTEKEAIKVKEEIKNLKLTDPVAPIKFRRPPLCHKHSAEVPDSGGAGGSGGAGSTGLRSGNHVTSPTVTARSTKRVAATRTTSQTFEFDGEIFHLSSPKLPCDVKTCEFCFEEKSEKARLVREESYRVLKEKRTSEILSAFQKTKLLWEQKATEDSKKMDQAWQQQEKQAKQAETKLRLLVKGAREDYKRNSMRRPDGDVTMRTSRMPKEVFRESAVLMKNVVAATTRVNKKPRPADTEEIAKWFKEEEKPKRTGLTDSGCVESWFHGLISREEAETMLSEEPPHSYLVRVSEKIWGYAISYKADGRCKHYLVDTTDYGYQFFGTNQLEHSSLSQLIQYHKNHPISTAGQELLKLPVSQSKTPPDYAALFPELLESTPL